MGEEEYRRMYGTDRATAIENTRKELREAAKSKDKNRVKEIYGKLRMLFLGDDVLWASEVLANLMVSFVMIMLSVILVVTLAFSKGGVFQFDTAKIAPVFAVCIAQMIVGIILCTVFRGEKHWLKYLLMFFICVTVAATYSAIGFRAAISLTLPVILSVRYLSERFTKFVAGISGVFMLTSTITYAYMGVAVNLNCISLENGTILTVTGALDDVVAANGYSVTDYLEKLIIWDFVPNLMQFIVIAFICIKVAKWGHHTVINQADVAKEFTRVDTELSVATHIQADMLPNIFPAFPDRSEFEIYAAMDPAKEVGGDFYDFFLIDDNTLGMVMADVSGKGVPAALFMMIGKTLIKNQAQLGLSPAEVLTRVNEQLCENNEEGFFITAWFGKLDLTTGELTAANAGHEYPAIARTGGKYELFKDKHGFVLAGMDGVCYKEYNITLNPGDKLFLYTDGVTEATNAGLELFGTDRMVEALNRNLAVNQAQLLINMRSAIDSFVGKAPQADDITMLGLKYNGPRK